MKLTMYQIPNGVTKGYRLMNEKGEMCTVPSRAAGNIIDLLHTEPIEISLEKFKELRNKIIKGSK